MTEPAPAAYLDLSPAERADALVLRGLVEAEAARLREEATPVLLAQAPEVRELAEYLLLAIARVAATAEALAQLQREARRTREERLRLDPLRLIAADRAGAPDLPAERGPVALDAGAEDFAGEGWFPPERVDGGWLRWSGKARCATVVLPGLGGGRLAVTLALRAPFGEIIEPAEQDWFLDGVALPLRRVSGGGGEGVFHAEVTLPAASGPTRAVLLLCGRQFEDPAAGPRRDTRRLGLGLTWARVERAA